MMHGSVAVPKAHNKLQNTAALSSDVGQLRFVSKERLQALRRMGIETVRDLFLHGPSRYLDYRKTAKIGEAKIGQTVTIIATIDRIKAKQPRRNLSILEVYLVDDTGILRVSFFRQPWLQKSLKTGMVLAVSGKLTFSYGFLSMTPSYFDVVDSEGDVAQGRSRILPVHPVSEGLTSAWMRRIVSSALYEVGSVCEFMPANILGQLGLMSWANALRWIHFPPSLLAAEKARRRLAFDELVCLQLGLHLRRASSYAALEGFAHTIDGPLVTKVQESLGFSLTQDQRRAAEEILRDMANPAPMNRLLQGDVGTGKTAVAALALGAVADSNSQAAMMAPTSVLARQYAESLGPALTRAGIPWRLVTGATSRSEREAIDREVALGHVNVIFGTTALLSRTMAFHRLTLVIVDEQHRFGVNQRLTLANKGSSPDMLSMTATPIPRTLALSVYGDVAVSTMKERPRAGAGVKTQLIAPKAKKQAYDAILEAVAAGHQAYVVCPLVDENDDGAGLDDLAPAETGSLTSAVATQQELSQGVFRNLRVGLLHGRLSAKEKDDVMSAMRAGTIDVLVTTTVVEVGVDIPNATVMVILDAERFGLATLHQLRGRVGRGSAIGWVFLVSSATSPSPAYQRLQALERTSDGFELAELDLKLRHEGEILGYRQSGEVTFRCVDVLGDADLIEEAHRMVHEIVARDPLLQAPELQPLVGEVYARYKDRLRGGDG